MVSFCALTRKRVRRIYNTLKCLFLLLSYFITIHQSRAVVVQLESVVVVVVVVLLGLFPTFPLRAAGLARSATNTHSKAFYSSLWFVPLGGWDGMVNSTIHVLLLQYECTRSALPYFHRKYKHSALYYFPFFFFFSLSLSLFLSSLYRWFVGAAREIEATFLFLTYHIIADQPTSQRATLAASYNNFRSCVARPYFLYSNQIYSSKIQNFLSITVLSTDFTFLFKAFKKLVRDLKLVTNWLNTVSCCNSQASQPASQSASSSHDIYNVRCQEQIHIFGHIA